MPEAIANSPSPGDKPRTWLSDADAVRFFGSPPLFKGEDLAQDPSRPRSNYGRRGASRFFGGNLGQ